MNIRKAWERELLRRAFVADPGAPMSVAREAVDIALSTDPLPPVGDKFCDTLRDWTEALRILDDALAEMRADLDVRLSVVDDPYCIMKLE
jgi:hypothetical protein